MPTRRLGWLATVPVAALIIALAAQSNSGDAGGGIVTTNLIGPLEPVDLAESLAGGGVTVSNVTYAGSDVAAGTFSGALPVLGTFDSGVILSTGDISFVVPPNVASDITWPNGEPGDDDLMALARTPYSPNATVADGDGLDDSQTSFAYASADDPIVADDVIVVDSEQMLVDLVNTGNNTLTVIRGYNGTAPAAHPAGATIYFQPITFDAAVLEFDFVPVTDTLAFRFVFASDEYQESVNTAFNDVFAIYVNGTNCALVPNTSDPISINTINNGRYGNPDPLFPDDPTPHNPSLYRNNDFLFPPATPLDTEMDGLTVVLLCLATVGEGQTNHIKLAIADATDDQIDSVVFLQANSFTASGPGDTDCNSIINSVDALFVLRYSAQLPVSAPCIANGDVNCSGGLNAVDALLILRFSANLEVTYPPGCPPIGSGPGTPTPTPSPTPSPTMLQVDMGDEFFDPDALQVSASEPFLIDLTNVGNITHNMRIAGDDNIFGNADDIVSSPEFIDGGETGQVSGQLTDPGLYDLRCDIHPFNMTGTIQAN